MEKEIEEIVNAKKFTLIAGPCVIESEENVMLILPGSSEIQGVIPDSFGGDCQ